MLFFNYNQDHSCISVGTTRGLDIYHCDPFTPAFSMVGGGVRIVEMLFTSSLLAIVGSGEVPNLSPRTLVLYNTKKNSVICEINFPTTILSVGLNRKRISVVLHSHIHVLDSGEVIEDGPPAAIKASERVRHAYMGTQADAEGDIL